MGQRLNIEFIDNEDNCVVNCYFHWAAYSSSSVNLLDLIISLWEEEKNTILADKPLDYQAISLLEQIGAGIIYSDLPEVKYPELEKEAISRNDGLICITENSIEDTRSWEEGRVTINLLKETFDFNVFYSFTREDLKDSFMEEDKQILKDINNAIPISLTNSFKDIDQFKKLIFNNKFFSNNGIFYQVIE